MQYSNNAIPAAACLLIGGGIIGALAIKKGLFPIFANAMGYKKEQTSENSSAPSKINKTFVTIGVVAIGAVVGIHLFEKFIFPKGLLR